MREPPIRKLQTSRHRSVCGRKRGIVRPERGTNGYPALSAGSGSVAVLSLRRRWKQTDMEHAIRGAKLVLDSASLRAVLQRTEQVIGG